MRYYTCLIDLLKENKKVVMRKIMPPTYFLILLLISIGLNFLVPIYHLIKFPYSLFGILLILIGIVLDLWSESLFKKRKINIHPTEIPTFLEKSGPFKISRNPMYLGGFVGLLGVSLILGSVIAFISPILFATIINILFIPIEEKNLEKAIGKEYEDYKRQARRWI